MKRTLIGATCFAVLLLARPTPAFEPTGGYEERTVQGFTLLVSPEARKHAQELDAAVAEIEGQLRRASDVVPADALAALRKVRVWVEWDNPRDATAEFHPSKRWLKENGYNPDKAGGVEIGHIVRFVKWSKQDQPWMLLHELAHAYHHRVLGDDNAEVKSAYRAAMKAKLYDAVEYVHGGKRKAYAAGDAAEYFAELSEAYFGKNDYYPFTRDDLKKHDPDGFRVVEKLWSAKARGESP